MTAFKTIETISLERIDLSNETFSVNFMPDLEGLRSSIRQMGLLHPVLLRKTGETLQIICGFRRIRMMREWGRKTIEARILEVEETDELRLFSIALHDNLTGRGFNTVETAIALDKLLHYFRVEPSVVIQTFLPLFSLEMNEKILNTYLSLARMEEEVKRYVVQQKVSRSNIRKLAPLTAEDRRAVLSLVFPLKLGENTLRETLTLLEEIARRDQRRIRDIVSREEIQSALTHSDLTASQKTERIKRMLTVLRYPRLHRLEESFDRKKKALNLPPGLSVDHDPHFEGNRIKMELRFETLEEYRSLVGYMSALSEGEEFQGMLRDNR